MEVFALPKSANTTNQSLIYCFIDCLVSCVQLRMTLTPCGLPGEIFFVCHNSGVDRENERDGCYWHPAGKVGDAIKHPRMYRAAPWNKELPCPNVNSDTVKKSYCLYLCFWMSGSFAFLPRPRIGKCLQDKYGYYIPVNFILFFVIIFLEFWVDYLGPLFLIFLIFNDKHVWLWNFLLIQLWVADPIFCHFLLFSMFPCQRSQPQTFSSFP